MLFKKYPSIENSYREKEIERIIQNEFASKNIEWVCTEKIDGSNFSFICNGKDIKCATRNSILNNNELSKFYDADIILEKYKDKIFRIFNYINIIYDINEIQVYGEHFGGSFNGKTEKGYSKIQKRIDYIPFTDFIVFDILVKYKTPRENNELFLYWDQVKELSKKFEFKVVPELFRGSFKECLNYSNLFLTKIPEMYKLKNKENNIAEGIVLKPNEPLFFKTGERVILKNKNDKFKEIGKVKKIKKNIKLTDEEKVYVNEITKYFEVSRIQSVLSKGEVKLEWKQFGKLSGLFFKDALEDFIKDNPQFLKLEKGIKKAIQKEAQKILNDFIREFMKKEI